MKQYVIDEIRPDDHRNLKKYLDEHLETGPMEGLYWLQLEKDRLRAIQAEHLQCQPFYAALELSPDRLSCELLIRTHQHVRCECMGYADEDQRNWIIQTIDAIFDKLNLFV